MSSVLIAVSDRDVRERLNLILKNTRCSVHYVGEELQAAESFSKYKPDIIIADIDFTEWFLNQLKQSLIREIPVICYIKDYNARLAYDLMKKGAYDCIVDPLKSLEIVDIINKALSTDILSFEKILKQNFFDYFAALPRIKKTYFSAAASGVFFLFLYLIFTRGVQPKGIAEVPHKNVTGLIAGGHTIFLSDWYTQSVYRYKRDTGELMDVYYFSDFGPLGIATDGKAIWSIGTDMKIRKHMLNEAAKNLSTVGVFPVNLASPGGICIEKRNIWLTDTQLNKIISYEIVSPAIEPSKSDSLKFVAEYVTGNISPEGILKIDENIFLMDGYTGSLLSGVVFENRYVPKKEFSVKLPNERVLSIAASGKKMFLVIAGDKTTIKQIPLSSLK